MATIQRPVRSRHHREAENIVDPQEGIDDTIPLPPELGELDSGLGLVWENSKKRHSKREGVGDDIENDSAGRRTDHSDNLSKGAGSSIEPSAPQIGEIDTLIADYISQKNKIMEQHAVIESKKEMIRVRKENERKRITDMFSDILDILADKEASLLCKLDEKYKPHENKLDDLLSSAEDAIVSINSETNIAENMKSGDRHFQDVSLTDMIPLLNDIKIGTEERAEGLSNNDSEIPDIEFNNEAIVVINDLTFVTIPNTDNDQHEEVLGDEQNALDNDSIDSLTESENRTVNDRENENHSVGSNTRGQDQSENAETDEPIGGSLQVTLPTEADHLQPTAPPEAEEDPPPYWQAIGLSGPAETENLPPSRSPTRVTSNHAPHYSRASQYGDNASSSQHANELVFFHNFLLKRPYDSRAPKPVAISWNMEKILVADRANSKVKVFSGGNPSFKFLTEMYLGGCEIYDMAFVEVDGDEMKYVVTMPQAKTLMFISLSSDNIFRMVYKLKLSQGYIAVAKGPTGNTLVGADHGQNNGCRKIDIINMQGKVLRSFKEACSVLNFSYPRCIEVYREGDFCHAIIVADWKLNLVVVLHEDEGAVAQYGGTQSYPLKEPCCLTTDQFGNIMVVDGKTGNIHVIDLQCQPLEVIKCPRGETAKLISFDKRSHRLAIYRKTGDVGIYDFRDGYHAASRNFDSPVLPIGYLNQPEYQGTLPLVEGMLPTTIANAGRGRHRQTSSHMTQPGYHQDYHPQYSQGYQQLHQPSGLPHVEGMLPSTIANFGIGRQRQAYARGNYNMFHL